jgi:hypothetical protein
MEEFQTIIYKDVYSYLKKCLIKSYQENIITKEKNQA